MAKDLAVGLLGFGVAGAVFHAPLLAATPGLRLAAVVTRDAERRAQAAAEHPGVELLDDAEQLFASAPDLVVVATPNRSHALLALAAIEAGLPVVVDKPFAVTAEEGRQVLAEAARRAVPLTVFHNRRWDGDFRTVQALVQQGRLGTVHRFESRFERWRPTPKPGWRESGTPNDAGGLLYDLGPHLVDQAVVLQGPVRSVYCERARRRSGVQVDDDAFVALTHGGGAVSHLWMSALAADPGPRFRVMGDLGAYVVPGLDGQEAALRAGSHPGDPGWGQTPPEQWGRLDGGAAEPTEDGRYQDFYSGVAASLRDGAPMPVEPADAVRGLELLEAAARSAQSGQVVRP